MFPFPRTAKLVCVPVLFILLTRKTSNPKFKRNLFDVFLTQDSKAHRVAVGIGRKIKKEELLKIADSPNRVVQASNFEDLNKKLEAIREAVCNKKGRHEPISTFDIRILSKMFEML